MSRFAILTVALFALLAPPASGASGVIAGGDAGFEGVTGRGIEARYVARHVPHGTLLMAIDRRGGRLLQARLIRERLAVSMVAFDGTGTGLSADGGTLVLAPPRISFPRGHSRFVVFDATRLRRVSDFTLRGDFALDAISLDGDRLYFIESTSTQDLSRYRVRAYDLAKERLLPKPVVDPEEADEPMRGSPISRVLSHDGRWAYTLYDGNGEHPFIHALDTTRGRAKCIDLDDLAGRQDLMDLRLGVGGDGSVMVRNGITGPVLVVDPRTFAVSEPRPAAPSPPPPPSEDGGAGWLGYAAGAALLVLLAVAAVRLGGRRVRRTAAG
jgi:hypothetical protein